MTIFFFPRALMLLAARAPAECTAVIIELSARCEELREEAVYAGPGHSSHSHTVTV